MKSRSRSYWLFLVGFALLGAVPAAAQRSAVEFEKLSLRDGLSQGTVFAIVQDRLGYMWFGTADGLNRYDGYEFRHYRTDPLDSTSISDNRVITLLEDRSGRLWAGTLGGGLCLYDRASETFIRYRHHPGDSLSLSDDRVNSLYEDGQGTIWVGTTHGGLNRFDPESGRFVRYQHDPENPSSISDNHIYPIHEHPAGVLWVGTPKGLNIFQPETGTFARILHDSSDTESLSHDYVNTITSDRRGTLWVGTVNGLNRLLTPVSGGTMGNSGIFKPRFAHLFHDSTDRRSLSSGTIWALYEDRLGTLWVGTDVGGLNRYDPKAGTFERFLHDPDDPTSLSHNAIRSITQDQSGTLWIGTNAAGVNTWNPLRKKFQSISAKRGTEDVLSSNWVRAVYEQGDGHIWIGSSVAMLDLVDSKTGTATHEPMPGTIEAILGDGTGTVWLGSSTGLYTRNRHGMVERAAERAFAEHDTLIKGRIRSLARDRHGNLWIGYFRRGAARLERGTNRLTHFGYDPADSTGISDNYVRAVYRDHSGDLWIGSYGGLDVYDEATGRFRHYRYDPADRSSLSNNNVLCLFDFPADSGKVLWVGTFGGGLNRLDKVTGRVTRTSSRDGLPNDVVYGILGDDAGNLWLSTNRGLTRMSTRTGEIRSFDESDGLQGFEFSTGAYHLGSSGTMYFGGVNGFSWFHPDSIQDNRYAPPVVVTRMQTLDGVVRPPADKPGLIELSYTTKYLTFEFASLDYTNPSKNQYAYRMEGFDDAWTQSGSRRFASFTKLDPGTYTFVVRGTNSNGVWSDHESRIEIIVTPPFWERWWFLSVSALVFVAAGYGTIRRRERLKEEKARILGELQSARRVQMGLMPTSDPVVPGLDVSGVCTPAHEVGGDFFDYVWLDPGHTKLGIVLADVSGKGMNAAMTAVMASGMLYREVENDPIPSQALRNINRSLFLKTDKRMFVSMLFAVFDTQKKTMVFSNAGQSLPFRRRGEVIRTLTGAGDRFALGMIQTANYDNCTVELQQGDVLVFYTDGVSEASNEKGDQLEADRLSRIIAGLSCELSAREMIREIINAIEKHTGSSTIQDDSTIVVVKVD